MRDTKSLHAGRIDDIEILRAIAVLITIMDHIRFMFRWENSALLNLETYATFWSGVDLFFAISGFVIARDLLKHYDRASTNEQFWRETFAFWIRRIYRIWPTAWLWASLYIVFGELFRSANLWPPLRPALIDMAAVMTHVVNIHQWMCAYQMPRAACGSTTVWWSLSLEEQFYIALPVVFLLSPRRYLPHVLAIVVASQFFLHRDIWSLGWVLRTDALALGVLVALFERTRIYPLLTPKFMENRFAAAMVLIILLFLLIELPSNLAGKIEIVPFSTGMVALVSGFTVFLASYNNNVFVRNRVLKSILLWIGSRSYAIYLINAFCITLTPQVWKWLSPTTTTFGPNWTIRFLAMFFFLSFGLAELNYRFIETPIRKKGREVANRIAHGKSFDSKIHERDAATVP